MTKDEALKLALETLECWQRNEDCNEPMSKILESIKEALAQPKEQEPVAWLQICLAPLHEGDVIARTTKPTKWNPEWWRFEPLYTTPPQRTWVGMSEEEKIQFMVAYYSSNWDTKTLIAVMDNYEAKLKDKNT